MTKHWSARLTCRCGMSFRSVEAEARHRHNFPAMCRKPRERKMSVSLTASETGTLLGIVEAMLVTYPDNRVREALSGIETAIHKTLRRNKVQLVRRAPEEVRGEVKAS